MSSPVFAALLGSLATGDLPRLEAFSWDCLLVLPFFCLAHLGIWMLLQLVRRPALQRHFPLLQQGVWPRHGANRLCCILHSAVAFLWGFAVLYREGAFGRALGALGAPAVPGALPYFGSSISALQRPLLLYSLSFFVYDLVYVFIERDVATTLHHLGAVAAFITSFSRSVASADIVAGLTVGECSTPLLHLRYFARHYCTLAAEAKQRAPQKDFESAGESPASKGAPIGEETEDSPEGQTPAATPAAGSSAAAPMGPPEAASRGPPGGPTACVQVPPGIWGLSFVLLNRAAELLFVFTFITARALVAPAVTAATCVSARTPLLVKAMALTVCFISFYWIGQIFFLVYYRGSAGRQRRKKTV